MTTRVYKVEVMGQLYLVDAASQSQAINVVLGAQVKAEVIGTSELGDMVQRGFPILRPTPKAEKAAEPAQAPHPEAAPAAAPAEEPQQPAADANATGTGAAPDSAGNGFQNHVAAAAGQPQGQQ